MPLYEYRCEACGAQEECLEPMAAPTAHACPACAAPSGMQRVLSVAAVTSGRLGTPAAGPAAGGCCPGSGGSCPFA